MKVTKIVNKLGIGTKIKVKFLIFNKTEIVHVKFNTSSPVSTRLALTNGMYMDKDLTISGMDAILAKCKLMPYKRYKFRYKR